jgi:alanine dehydrogenase
MTAPLWISEAEVAELLTLAEAIDVLADAHRRYYAGAASNMVRTHATDGTAILHAVGGILGDVAGTKTWMHTPGGAQPLLVLFSPPTGQTIAVIEAFALGQLRTAATCGLGTRLLADPEASTLAILGTGKQALSQVAAIAAVRPITQVRVFGRDARRRGDFVNTIKTQLRLEAIGHDTPAGALDRADIATVITRAQEPFVTAAMLPEQIHVNAAGAIVLSRRELTADAIEAFELIAVDSLPQARKDSGELLAAEDPWPRTHELGELVVEGTMARNGAKRTLLKALGVGIADVAIGAEIATRAHAMQRA